MQGYTGYKLTERSRNQLKQIWPPIFERFIGHHITEKFGVGSDSLPDQPESIQVIGYAIDDGVEALVVAINGSEIRPDGKIYHITWSLADGRKPVESNQVISKGWTKIEPTPVEAIAKFFKF